MKNTNITNFRNNIYEFMDQAIEYNDVINVNTKKGNAIVMSEEDYNNLMETLYLFNNKQTRDDIIEGINTPLDECIGEDNIQW